MKRYNFYYFIRLIMKILLVEDNKKISWNIKKFLELDWFEVDCEYDWKKWLERLQTSKYDIMLLDIMLPWLDGIQVCKQARQITEMPIIMITAKHQMEDKMEWFDCGADDYITKPFELVELLARIKAITKRLNKYFSFQFKNIEIIPEKKKNTKGWDRSETHTQRV